MVTVGERKAVRFLKAVGFREVLGQLWVVTELGSGTFENSWE